MPVSSKTTTKRWSNPFKKNAKGTKDANLKPCKREESFNSATTTASSLSLSSTSVASDLSMFPVRYPNNAQWDMPEILPPAPVFKAVQDTSAKYGYEEASPSAAEKCGYDDTTSDDKAKFGYGDTTSPRASFCRTPRRSSMKQSGAPRRASIQFGGEIQANLPGKKNPVKRRTSITFKETVKVKNVAPVSKLTDQPEALWFQDEDYNRMRQKSFALVDREIMVKYQGEIRSTVSEASRSSWRKTKMV
jgi:hypothetical protein